MVSDEDVRKIIKRLMAENPMDVERYFAFLTIQRGMAPIRAEALVEGWQRDVRSMRRLFCCMTCGRQSMAKHPDPCPFTPVEGWISP